MGNPDVHVPLPHLLLKLLQIVAEPLEDDLRALFSEHPAGGVRKVDLVAGEVAENPSCGGRYDGLLPAGKTLQQSCRRGLPVTVGKVSKSAFTNLSFLRGNAAVHHRGRVWGKPAIPEQTDMKGT